MSYLAIIAMLCFATHTHGSFTKEYRTQKDVQNCHRQYIKCVRDDVTASTKEIALEGCILKIDAY